MNSENQEIPMKKDLHLMTFVYLDILYLLISFCRVPISILSVCHNHHIFSSSTLLFMKTKEREIMFLIRIHYDDGNTVLFISVADWRCTWAYFVYLCIFSLYLHSCSFVLWSHISSQRNFVFHGELLLILTFSLILIGTLFRMLTLFCYKKNIQL